MSDLISLSSFLWRNSILRFLFLNIAGSCMESAWQGREVSEGCPPAFTKVDLES